MKFDILNRQFKDKAIENIIIKMFEYFATLNSERAETIKKSKNREDLIEMLTELAHYIESGLRKKFSENFIVLITEFPNYAMKYERFYLLGLKYGNFEIIITKSPFICIPAKFVKKLKDEEIEEINKIYEEKKDIINLKVLNYHNKYIHTISKDIEILKLKIFDDSFLLDIIKKNISYYSITSPTEKDLSKLALGIQYDICNQERDYNWCVIASKQQIYTKELITNSQVFLHCKIIDTDRKLNIKGLKDIEILIFKRVAVFESILKNILTGKLYEVELKHIVILVSVIIFFVLMSGCKQDYTNSDLNTLTLFEEKICLNKTSILSTIGIMFIFAVVSSMIRKRMNKNKK